MTSPDRRGFLLSSLRYAVLAGLSALTAGLLARGGGGEEGKCQGCSRKGDCQWQIEECRLQIGER